jgi:hypothetical protein
LFWLSSWRIFEYSDIELDAIVTEVNRQTIEGEQVTKSLDESSDMQHIRDNKLIMDY